MDSDQKTTVCVVACITAVLITIFTCVTLYNISLMQNLTEVKDPIAYACANGGNINACIAIGATR